MDHASSISSKRQKTETYFALTHNRHDDLAPTLAITGDMARKRLDVRHELRLGFCSGCATHAAPEGDGLARDFALERTQDELVSVRIRCVENVEACPIYLVGRGW